MIKEKFINELALMVAKNIIDEKIEYFLVCDVTENDERVYIYFIEKKNNTLYFKVETPFKDCNNISLDNLIEFLDKHYLNENKKTYCFYNVSLLER